MQTDRKAQPKQLIIFDIYENNAYDIQQELLREQPKLDLVVLIGSVRDENRINSIFEQYRPEIIYHAAAHKHVPLMEGSRTRLSRIMSSELIIWSEWQINGMLRDLYRYLQIRLSTQRISWELPRESVR